MGAANSLHGRELIFKATHRPAKTSNVPPALLAKEDTHNREPLAVYYRAVRSQPKCNKLPIRAKCLPPPRRPSRGTRDGPAKVPVQMHPQTHRHTHGHTHAFHLACSTIHRPSSTRMCGECTLTLIHRSPFFTASILDDSLQRDTPNGALQYGVLNYVEIYITHYIK